MVVIVIVVFIVLVVILVNKDKSDAPSDDSKGASTNRKRIKSRNSHSRKSRQTRDTVSTNRKRIESRDSVVVKDIKMGKKNKYQLVGTDEPDLNIGKISIKSPLGGSLIGKEIGDDVQVITPGGIREFIVIDIE